MDASRDCYTIQYAVASKSEPDVNNFIGKVPCKYISEGHQVLVPSSTKPIYFVSFGYPEKQMTISQCKGSQESESLLLLLLSQL